MQVFESKEAYLASLPEAKRMAVLGYRQNKTTGKYYKLVKAKDVILAKP